MSYWLNMGIMILIAFTRVYLGVHTFMQIFMGGLLAIELYLIGEYFKQDVIRLIINPILMKKDKNKFVLKSVTCFVIIYLILATYLFVSLRNWELNDKEYFSAITNCKIVLKKGLSFSGKDFGQVLMISYFYGFFLGIYFF